MAINRKQPRELKMLTLFGSVAVLIMFFSYWMKSRSKWVALVFPRGSTATYLYNAPAQAYPITVVEAGGPATFLERASSGNTWLMRASEPRLLSGYFR